MYTRYGPIRLACLPHHRSDVRPVDRQELAFAGLGESDFAVVCRERLIMARQEVVRIGVVPGAMWERITRAMEREDAVSAQEFCGGLGSALLAQTASSGRRVSAARYS